MKHKTFPLTPITIHRGQYYSPDLIKTPRNHLNQIFFPIPSTDKIIQSKVFELPLCTKTQDDAQDSVFCK